MTIVFLDIDGVMRATRSDSEWSRITNTPIPQNHYLRRFDRKSVSNLNLISHYTGAKIVISSSWRTGMSLDHLRKIFRNMGVNAEVIDKTPIGLNRGEEIVEWLDLNGAEKYVVIDDNIGDILRHISSKNVVLCNSNIGLADDSLVDTIIDILL